MLLIPRRQHKLRASACSKRDGGCDLKQTLHILLAVLPNKLVNLPKRMIVAHVADSPTDFITTEAALLVSDPEIVGALHYNPAVDRDTEMTRLKDEEAKDDHNL